MLSSAPQQHSDPHRVLPYPPIVRPLLELQKQYGNEAVETAMRIAPELLSIAQTSDENGIES